MGLLTQNFKTYFTYGSRTLPEKEYGNGRSRPETQQKTITCRVVERENEDNVVAERTVGLHYKDHDEKVLGRFFAFKKTMEQIDDSQIKKEIWQGYQEKIKMPSHTSKPE